MAGDLLHKLRQTSKSLRSVILQNKIFQKVERLVPFAQRGFTLVEMMMAMVTSAIVLIGIAVIVAGSHKHIINGRSKMRLQQDYSLIGQVLSNKIRGSIQSQQEIYTDYTSYTGGGSTQSSGSCLKLNYPNNDSIVIYQDGTDFKILNTDLTTTNLVQEILNNLLFIDLTRSIRTEFSLAQGKWSITDTLVDAFRNFNSTQTMVLRPMGVGSLTALVTEGCGSNWQCVSETTPDEDVTRVVRASNSYATDVYAMEDPATTTGSIDKVTVWCRAKRANNQGSLKPTIYTGGTEYNGTEQTLSASYVDYSHEWATNPNTSAAWTWQEIKDLETGLAIKGQNSSFPAYCTQVWLKVQYTN